MARKESLNKENIDLDFSSKRSPRKAAKEAPQSSSKFFGVIKFLLGICLLPFVYGISVSFLSALSYVDKAQQSYFWAGLATLLFVYFFIWEPEPLYNTGHKLLEASFSFVQPMVKVAPHLIPIYTIVLLAVYNILSIFIHDTWLKGLTVFLIGFTIALHLIFSARSLRSKSDDLLKANYIFGFSFFYILNLAILGLVFGSVSQQFSLFNFFSDFIQNGSAVFALIFKQLFYVG